MSLATLSNIQTKVRRLTRSPSESQITTSQLNDYINTFILYDFPANLRLFSLRRTLTFYTQPGVDTYKTIPAIPANSALVNDPLYNFRNKYIAVHPPVFLAGIPGSYTQQRDVFYGAWPQTNWVSDTLLRGDGATTQFSSIVVSPPPNVPPKPFILQRSVNFNALDNNGTSMVLVDVPINNQIGNLTVPNTPLVPPFDTVINPNNYINYVTGEYSLTFPSFVGNMMPIYFEGILYQPGKPIAMLYFNDEFVLRPVPDKTYAVSIEVDVRPTELLAEDEDPYLEQWSQYIAYGAAKKIFEDRMDMDSVQMIMPEFKNQECMVLRTTLTQQANERTTTIYSIGRNYNAGWFGSNWPY